MATRERPTYRDMRSRAEERLDEKLKEQVLAGIEWLNDTYGPDWVEWVDPAILNMGSCASCVLGQIGANQYGERVDGFMGVMRREGVNEIPSWASGHGFDVRIGVTYEDLDEAWETVLT